MQEAKNRFNKARANDEKEGRRRRSVMKSK